MWAVGPQWKIGRLFDLFLLWPDEDPEGQWAKPAYLEAREKGGLRLGSFQQGEGHVETNPASGGSLGDRRRHAHGRKDAVLKHAPPEA